MKASVGLWLLWTSACHTATINLVDDPRDAGPARPALDAGLAVTAPIDAAQPAHEPSARCGKRACACDDGLDNDQDGLSDGLDPECTGSFDDDEASFGIGKPNKQAACRDCFWDDNAGSGDDGCRYPVECLSGAVPNGNGNCSSCQVTAQCIDACRSRTPNGCDCFGCCAVVGASGSRVYVELSESCQLDRLDDQTACPRCVPDTACSNACGRCELCLGKQLSDLPADCAGAGPAYRCDDGQTVCASSADCVGASYCQLGCCLIDLL